MPDSDHKKYFWETWYIVECCQLDNNPLANYNIYDIDHLL